MADHGRELTLDGALAGLPPDFQFFGERFRTTIQPQLAARETDRVAAIRKQRTFTIYAVLAAIVLGGGATWMFQHPAGLAVGALAGFGLYAWGSAAINKLKTETKLMLVNPVAAEFGMAFQLNPGQPPIINRFLSLGLVPRWDRSGFEDHLSGARSQTPFEFFEAHLEERRRTTDSRGNTRETWVTVFRGQCLTARFPKEFKGITKVYRDMGALNFLAKFGVREPRVKLEDPVFEKHFEVYGTDQIESRFLLTPDFMERLLALERTFAGKQLRCAFAGGEMMLAVEGKNLLEAGSMDRRMDDLGRVREMLEDFAAIFLLIDSMCQRLTPEALRNPRP